MPKRLAWSDPCGVLLEPAYSESLTLVAERKERPTGVLTRSHSVRTTRSTLGSRWQTLGGSKSLWRTFVGELSELVVL